jgi:hypothetical protein
LEREPTDAELDDWCAPHVWTPAELAEQAARLRALRDALCPGYVRDMTSLDEMEEAVTQLYNSYPPRPDDDARLSGLSSECVSIQCSGVPPSTPTAPTTPSTPSAPTKPEFTQEELDDWCAPVEWTPAQLAEQAARQKAFRDALCPGYVRDMTSLDDMEEAVTQLYDSYPRRPDDDDRLLGLARERAGVL